MEANIQQSDAPLAEVESLLTHAGRRMAGREAAFGSRIGRVSARELSY